MKLTIHYSGELPISFFELKNHPEKIIKKMPRVKTIEKMDELDYRITSQPYVLHSGLKIKGVSHVNLHVEDNQISWSRSQHHCEETCNGCIEGTAVAGENDTTHLTGEICVHHPMINSLTAAFAAGMTKKMGERIMDEFIANFNDESFENEIPDA